MRKIGLIVSIFTLLLCSCKKGQGEIEHDYIAKTLESVNFPNSVKWIVILPGLGCHGCIQEGEAFMREYVNNKEIMFILTKVESLKILEHKIGIKLSKHSNIIIDNDEEINIPSDNSVYPCVVHIKNRNIESHEFQSPKNNAFEKLKSQVPIQESN